MVDGLDCHADSLDLNPLPPLKALQQRNLAPRKAPRKRKEKASRWRKYSVAGESKQQQEKVPQRQDENILKNLVIVT